MRKGSRWLLWIVLIRLCLVNFGWINDGSATWSVEFSSDLSLPVSVPLLLLLRLLLFFLLLISVVKWLLVSISVCYFVDDQVKVFRFCHCWKRLVHYRESLRNSFASCRQHPHSRVESIKWILQTESRLIVSQHAEPNRNPHTRFSCERVSLPIFDTSSRKIKKFLNGCSRRLRLIVITIWRWICWRNAVASVCVWLDFKLMSMCVF